MEEEKEFKERVISINRCTKVVKGGRRFSFNALVVVGNEEGWVGIGTGKAQDVAESVRKATASARNNIVKVAVYNNTLAHEVVGEFCSTQILLKPASSGTGVISGGSARAVLELAGIKDVLSKVFGSTNPSNVVRAVLNGLQKQRTKENFKMLRSVN